METSIQPSVTVEAVLDSTVKSSTIPAAVTAAEETESDGAEKTESDAADATGSAGAVGDSVEQAAQRATNDSASLAMGENNASRSAFASYEIVARGKRLRCESEPSLTR